MDRDRAIAILEKAFQWAALLLFALLPLHAFLVTWLQFGLGLPGPLSAWKEFVILVLLALSGIGFVLKPKRLEFDKLDGAMLVFFGIGLISAILQFLKLGNESFVRIFYGFKYDFLMLSVFLLFRHGPFSSAGLTSKVAKTVLVCGIVVGAFALLHATILPRDFLASFGYTPAYGTWDPEGPIATYQALDENHPLVVRAMGTFAGPNQFAMYALIVLGISIGKVLPKNREKTGKNAPPSATGHQLPANRKPSFIFYLLASSLAVLGIIFSYSRSALVGFIAATIIVVLMGTGLPAFARSKWKAVAATMIGLLALGILALPFLAASPYVRSVFVRSGSSQGHWTRSVDGIKGILQKPVLGYGIGEAGPASTRIGSGEGWIPENWYLQIGLEYGLIGLAAWLAVLFFTAKNLYRRAQSSNFSLFTFHFSLLFSFIAINVACLFLHAWEDSAVAITWWGLAGLALRRARIDNQHQGSARPFMRAHPSSIRRVPI